MSSRPKLLPPPPVVLHDSLMNGLWTSKVQAIEKVQAVEEEKCCKRKLRFSFEEKQSGLVDCVVNDSTNLLPLGSRIAFASVLIFMVQQWQTR